MSGMSINDWQARAWRLHAFVSNIIPQSSFNVMIGVSNRRLRPKTELKLLIDPQYLRFTDWPEQWEGTKVTAQERQPGMPQNA